MSQSPTSSAPLSRDAEYFRNWDALGVLIKRGSSFSGRERNCVFLNTGGPRFADVSGVTHLDFLDDGRAVGLTDWDQDGDVDLWLANRTAPRMRLLRNDLPGTNRHLVLRLAGRTCNRDAIGARVEVSLEDADFRLVETVRAGDGFLTQSTKWVHFGVGQARRIKGLKVRWPGDATWEEFGGLETDARYRIVQGTGRAVRLPKPDERAPLAASPPKLPPSSDEARVVLTKAVTLPLTDYPDFDGRTRSLREGPAGPTLLNLWASWCQPCLGELRDFSEHREALESAGVTIVPLCTDRLQDSASGDHTAALEFLRRVGLSSRAGLATADAVAELTHLQSWIFYRQRPLPLPSSFLLDAEGRLAVIYRGATTAEQVLKDVQLLRASPERLAKEAFPATGRFVVPESGFHPLLPVRAYREGGYLADAAAELEKILANAERDPAGPESLTDQQRRLLVDVYRELASVQAERGDVAAVVKACQEAVGLDPDDPSLRISLAVALANQGDRAEAESQLERVASAVPANATIQRTVAKAWLSMQDATRATRHFSRALELDPDNLQTRFDLGVALQLRGDGQAAADQFQNILAKDPSSAHAANNLAWIYATDSDAKLRNGARAVELAERACQLTQNQQPVFLGTLSAAYAEAGQFDKAVETIRRAQRLAEGRGLDKLVANLERRLQLHERGLPYHRASSVED